MTFAKVCQYYNILNYYICLLFTLFISGMSLNSLKKMAKAVSIDSTFLLYSLRNTTVLLYLSSFTVIKQFKGPISCQLPYGLIKPII